MYRQDYVVFLRAADGKIAFLREYFDPVRADNAMARVGASTETFATVHVQKDNLVPEIRIARDGAGAPLV
jgi:hypothetical protein